MPLAQLPPSPPPHFSLVFFLTFTTKPVGTFIYCVPNFTSSIAREGYRLLSFLRFSFIFPPPANELNLTIEGVWASWRSLHHVNDQYRRNVCSCTTQIPSNSHHQVIRTTNLLPQCPKSTPLYRCRQHWRRTSTRYTTTSLLCHNRGTCPRSMRTRTKDSRWTRIP